MRCFQPFKQPFSTSDLLVPLKTSETSLSTRLRKCRGIRVRAPVVAREGCVVVGDGEVDGDTLRLDRPNQRLLFRLEMEEMRSPGGRADS